MQNLNSQEIALWKEEARRLRYIAMTNPSVHPMQSACIDYETRLGPWGIRLVLERYLKTPAWHASVSYVKSIGEFAVYDKQTGKQIFDAPDEAILKTTEWDNDEYQTARDILGELVGPLLHAHDQQVNEIKGPIALHWFIPEASTRPAISLNN